MVETDYRITDLLSRIQNHELIFVVLEEANYSDVYERDHTMRLGIRRPRTHFLAGTQKSPPPVLIFRFAILPSEEYEPPVHDACNRPRFAVALRGEPAQAA
jgi:hypothetical protein